METWRPAVGFEKFYEISDQGRVRSLDRLVRRRGWAILTGKVLGQYPNNKGRLMVTLCGENGARRRALVHHLVLEAFEGPRPEGQEGCHDNGNHTDNRRENLRWDTHQENCHDMRDHGTVYQLNRTHCPQRHEYLPKNLVPSALKNGNRACLACSRAKAALQKARKNGADIGTLAEVSDGYYQRILA